MIFYRITVDVELENTQESEKDVHRGVRYNRGVRYIVRDDEDTVSLCNTLSDEAEKIYAEGNKKCFIFLKNSNEMGGNDRFKKIRLRMMAVSASLKETKGCLEKLENVLSLKLLNINISETTFEDFSSSIRYGSGRYSVEDHDTIINDFNLPESNMRSIDVKEYLMTKEDMSLEEYEYKARKFLCDSTLLPELKRIFAKRNTPGENIVKGVPVQYLICIKNPEIRENVTGLLRDALYDAGRFQNSRLYEMTYKNTGFFGPSDDAIINDTYTQMKVCKGSLVKIEFLRGETGDERDTKHAGDEILEALGECIKYYRNEVQTFFCLPGEFPGIEKILMERLGNVPVIKIKEDQVNGEKATQYLEMLAGEAGLKPDDRLYTEVKDAYGTYDASDLKRIYDRWYNDYVRTNIYPGYADIITAEKQLVQKQPEGCAYEKLNKMTGLTEAKKVIDHALDYYKAQKVFKEKGMKSDRPAMHMVFTGNPGTAKTTVARLFARILKENEILSEGKLFELGRADLVGKYVGWTAPIVKRKFEEARGSVLFIDEAYSLVDGKDGMYGDEAINTIVAEMENHREDMVVIFAGYPKEMEMFLDKNLGLRSRIAFHVPFEDYSAEELFDIAVLIAEDKGLHLDSGVKEKLMPIFEEVRNEKDFGNGRFVRNMIEKAKMKQATRLVHSELENVTKDDCETLTADDFEEPVFSEKDKKRQIGFAV